MARGNATGNIKLLTAGHCGDTISVPIKMGDCSSGSCYNVGLTGLNCDHPFGPCEGSNYDVQKTNCGDTSCVWPRNCVWSPVSTSSPPYCYAITVVKNILQVGEGDPLLMLGYNIFETGGRSANVATNGVDVKWLTGFCGVLCNKNVGFQADHGMPGGASGGPAFYNNRAWGMLSVSNGTTYTNITYAGGGLSTGINNGAQYFLDVAVCITASC